jgi:hypothetical protein
VSRLDQGCIGDVRPERIFADAVVSEPRSRGTSSTDADRSRQLASCLIERCAGVASRIILPNMAEEKQKRIESKSLKSADWGGVGQTKGNRRGDNRFFEGWRANVSKRAGEAGSSRLIQ